MTIQVKLHKLHACPTMFVDHLMHRLKRYTNLTHTFFQAHQNNIVEYVHLGYNYTNNNMSSDILKENENLKNVIVEMIRQK